ncbi:TPA: AAA family ATPase [Pasteurella multocida]|uniref:AAA family ATPase n=1 Tax=Pasteurella multocida TaxID=747 RepID=UPI00193C6AEF|nr:AAA family ATPase [Pasteurella multocida]MBM2608639.1 AAA family ATPase [Pasteurella multocida]
MRISHIKIKNFRKLKECSINLSNRETLFVGANNSGKTSAMHALMFFLSNSSRKLKITDFSINFWGKLDEIGESWLSSNIDEHKKENELQNYCPSLYITLSDIKKNDLPRVKHLIPTLSWDITSNLHVHLVYQPENFEKFKEDFIKYISEIRNLVSDKSKSPLPNSMIEFLTEKINSYFKIKYYLTTPLDSSNLYTLNEFPFEGIFKLSLIPAQRKFADSTDIDSKSNSLSDELSKFYNNHLDPKKSPTREDLNALKHVRDLQDELTSQLNNSFKDALKSLKSLGYPSANYDPEIRLESYIDSSEILKQNTKVKFGDSTNLSLPEELNGLGYRNLIYIFFKLLMFKSEWLRSGKSNWNNETPIEPIHLILIEEPEAHLHSQVQQVFVKKAYEILTENVDNNSLTTQLVISTHSSYISHEIGFENLHYFKRTKDNNSLYSEAVDLSNVFNNNLEENRKFVSRYLRTVHCDLFFANAIILVEGSAEKMLIPYFIHHNFSELDSNYISIIEVNGAHAHRFKPLIDALGVPTLVLTDLDSVDQQGHKIRPERNAGQKSGCDNLDKWLSLPDRKLESILELKEENKVINNTFISYQIEIPITWNNETINVIPYTFEDSIMFSNLELFKDKEKIRNSTGMLKKMHRATQHTNITEVCEEVFKALNVKGGKTQMALDILYLFDPNNEDEKFEVPNYIKIGLNWLTDKLNSK